MKRRVSTMSTAYRIVRVWREGGALEGERPPRGRAVLLLVGAIGGAGACGGWQRPHRLHECTFDEETVCIARLLCVVVGTGGAHGPWIGDSGAGGASLLA